MLTVAHGGEHTEVIKCITPECANNSIERSECLRDSIEVEDGKCMNYAPDRPKMARHINIKKVAADKDITIEVPESNAKDIKSPADKAPETLQDASKEEALDISKVKSQVWQETLETTVEDAIDVDAAVESWFKNMKDNLGKKLSADEISEADYDGLLSELEDMKENGVLSDAIKAKILEGAEEIPAEESAEKEPAAEGEKEETLEDLEKKPEGEENKEEPKKEKKVEKKKDNLPELPGLDLENV
jgi:hypothetical protein